MTGQLCGGEGLKWCLCVFYMECNNSATFPPRTGCVKAAYGKGHLTFVFPFIHQPSIDRTSTIYMEPKYKDTNKRSPILVSEKSQQFSECHTPATGTTVLFTQFYAREFTWRSRWMEERWRDVEYRVTVIQPPTNFNIHPSQSLPSISCLMEGGMEGNLIGGKLPRSPWPEAGRGLQCVWVCVQRVGGEGSILAGH